MKKNQPDPAPSLIDVDLSRRLRFEEMLSDISARLMAVPFDQVDGEIENALRKIKDFFQVDLCALLEVQEDRGICQSLSCRVWRRH